MTDIERNSFIGDVSLSDEEIDSLSWELIDGESEPLPSDASATQSSAIKRPWLGAVMTNYIYYTEP